MKKTTTLIIAFLICNSIQTLAQVTLYGDDIYHSGSFNMAIDESGNLELGSAGANQVWDFSSATADENLNFDIVSYSSSWNDANLAYVNDGDTFDFVRKTVNELITYVPIQNLDKFSFEPLKSMAFPLNYGDQSRDSFILINYYAGGEIGMSQYDSVRIYLKVALYSVTDAWGKMKLPQAEYDVLRVRSQHLIAVKIATKDGNEDYVEQPFLGSEERTENYSWYAPQQGYYVADYEPEGGTVQYLTSSVLGSRELSLSEDINIANPFSNQLKIENTGTSTLELSFIDMNGLEQKQVSINSFSTKTIDASDLAQGMYVVCITNPDNKQVSYRKLIKN